MASQARRQRQRALTREQILRAAVEIAREEGWPGVTMRKIADRIAYTHPALYAYFATKEDLLLALFHEGTDLLLAEIVAARDAATSPQEALFAIGAAYWRFAWHHRELYQVMNGLGGVTLDHPETITEGQRITDVVATAIRALPGQDGSAPAVIADRVALLWSTVHGLVTLAMAGRFPQARAERLIAQAVRDAFVAWGIEEPAST